MFVLCIYGRWCAGADWHAYRQLAPRVVAAREGRRPGSRSRRPERVAESETDGVGGVILHELMCVGSVLVLAFLQSCRFGRRAAGAQGVGAQGVGTQGGDLGTRTPSA
eukprot:3494357-Prymnesium_polylepis.1